MQVLTKRLPKQLGLVDAKTVCPELRRPRVGRLNSKTQHCHTPQGTSSYRDVDCGGNTRSRPWRSTRTRPRPPADAPGCVGLPHRARPGATAAELKALLSALAPGHR